MTMPPPMSADDLKSIRAHLGITQKQMADAIGVARQTIYRYERGTESIPAGKALLIRHAAESMAGKETASER